MPRSKFLSEITGKGEISYPLVALDRIITHFERTKDGKLDSSFKPIVAADNDKGIRIVKPMPV